MPYPEEYSIPTMLGRFRIGSTPAIIKTDMTVTLKIHGMDKICFTSVDDDFQDKADIQGRDEYVGTPIAHIRIVDDPPTFASTLHVILSDGNILHQPTERSMSPPRAVNTVNRVYHAILGAILSLCDDSHVLNSAKLWETDSTTTLTGQPSTRFVFNRHELLKIFYSSREPARYNHEFPTYYLRAYTGAEIVTLIRSTYSRGKTFSIQKVSDTSRDAYSQSVGQPAFQANVALPKELMILAYAASMAEEEDRQRDLFWN